MRSATRVWLVKGSEGSDEAGDREGKTQVSPRCKSLWILIGCWVLGCPVGLAAAHVYYRMMYDPEPDPVHFDVGGVFLLVWLVVAVAGTGLAVKNLRRSRRQ